MPKPKRTLTPEEINERKEKRSMRRAMRKAAATAAAEFAENDPNNPEGESSSAFGKKNFHHFTEEELALPRPPPYLQGKMIGLWYSQRSKSKKVRESPFERRRKKAFITLPLVLPPEKELQISQLLTRISTEAPPSVTKIRTGSSSTLESAIEKYQHIRESAFKDNFLKLICGNISNKIKMGIKMTRLARDEYKDKQYKEQEEQKVNNPGYRTMLGFRKKLPAFNKREEILELIANHNVILISGETGCGKTTQVAQFILDQEIMNNRGSICHIMCTQPRRISAISVAERVAEERSERCGQSVGYQIRLEKILPRKTGSILFCTTGVLLQIMNSDPFLTNVSHVILDEIHERDTISDFVIAVLKDIVPSRPDLKVILMSATLNAEKFSQYFNNCPHINIPGFTFPVTEYYLEDVYTLLKYKVQNQPNFKAIRNIRKRMKPDELKKEELMEKMINDLEKSRKYSSDVIANLRNPISSDLNIDLMCKLLKHICDKEQPGAILVFLPGWDTIAGLNRSMGESGWFPSSRYLIIPLHSMMPTVSQKEIFNRPPKGVRKIVLATNIAETSITIDDIVYVVDCGKIKIKMFDLENNVSTLKEHWVSLANAKQRRGRAGRVQPGVCYHLFSKPREEVLEAYQLPEMLRVRLEEVILQAKVLQVGKIGEFLQKVIDPPDPRAVDISLKLLTAMNALDEDEQLTPLGYHLAQLPVDPQAGKMILLAAMFGCLDPIASIASSLSYKDPFVCPLGQEKVVDQIKKDLDYGRRSDHLLIAQIMTQWDIASRQGRGSSFAREYYVSNSILELLRDMKQQFADHLYRMNFLASRNVKSDCANINSNNLGLVKAIICSGLYPNICVVRSRIKKNNKPCVSIATVEDGKIGIHPKSVNFGVTKYESSFLMYYMKLKGKCNILVHDVTLVYPLALIFFCHNLQSEDDGQGGKVIVVNNHIRFNCKASTANLIHELRAWLDWLLEYKVSHPGVTNWDSKSDECLILSAIIELIATEHNMYYSYEDNDESGESESENEY